METYSDSSHWNTHFWLTELEEEKELDINCRYILDKLLMATLRILHCTKTQKQQQQSMHTNKTHTYYITLQ